jgi:hypothetical protein
VITKQVIERHLVSPLADVLSPNTSARYSEKDIQYIAMEPLDAVQFRQSLLSKMKILEDGQDAFSIAMNHNI